MAMAARERVRRLGMAALQQATPPHRHIPPSPSPPPHFPAPCPHPSCSTPAMPHAVARPSLSDAGKHVHKQPFSCNNWILGPPHLVRYSSNVSEGFHDEASDFSTDLPGNFGSPVSEVAAATVDCSYPTAFLQLLIENVHIHTGLPWWASIVATTIAIRTLMLPVVIFQLKSAARFSVVRPELEKITNRVKESGYDSQVVEEQRMRMKELLRKHNASPFSPFLGGLLQAPVFMCFFFGIRNMSTRVESFKEGGIFWFTDLSTPDTTYILPLLTALTLWVTIEVGAVDGLEGNPMAEKVKLFFRAFAALSVPITATFEKALLVYWLTSNLWSLFQSTVFKLPEVKDALGIVAAPLANEPPVSVKTVELATQQPKRVSKSAFKMQSPEQRSKRAYKRK